MKKLLLFSIGAMFALGANAQTVITDSVIIGAGYANQVWYSMNNDEQGTQAKDNWDLAFDMVSIQSSIRINSAAGVKLWGYPKSDISGWSSVDTTGLSTWMNRWNSDTSWAYGAMGIYADPNNGFDLDWGIYDLTTHKVVGDSLYIIQLTNGDYKKLWMVELASGVFSFKFADLNGSNEITASVTKSNYTGKNFAYYSIANQTALNREPNATDWDLVFTQYTGFVPIPYTLTGVLHNRGVFVAQADNIPNPATYVDYGSQTYMSEINTIGYDYKSFNGTSYDIKDSVVYFVATDNGDVWKVLFTGFESSNGMTIFTKQKLLGTSISNVNDITSTMALVPNPAAASSTKLVYKLGADVENAFVTVYDLTGKVVYHTPIESNSGLHQYSIPTGNLISGTYIVSVKTSAGQGQQKLVIQ